MPHHNFPEDIHPLHHKYIGHSTKHFPLLLNLYHWLFYTDSQRFIYCNLREGIDFYGLVLFYEYLVFCVNVKNNLLLAYHDRKKNMWSDCQNALLYCKKLETFYAKDYHKWIYVFHMGSVERNLNLITLGKSWKYWVLF